MAEPVNESTFWWVISGTWAVGCLCMTALAVWVRGLADVSIQDRRMLWDALRKQISDTDEMDKEATRVFVTKQDIRELKGDLERLIIRQTEDLRRMIENRPPLKNR